MNKKTLIVLSLFILIAALLVYFTFFKVKPERPEPPFGKLKLSSPAFLPAGDIPAKYTCEGENVNPPLVIEGVPQTAKSLVLLVEDPDAVRVFTHWLVWNVKPDTVRINENSVPESAAVGVNGFGQAKYNGPCPPDSHRYSFKLYALNVTFDLSLTARKEDLLKAMEGHVLEQAGLLGKYGRK